MSVGALRYRLEHGDWRRLGSGLYWTLDEPPPSWLLAWVAWSTAPAGTVVSHQTAAGLHGLPLPPGPARPGIDLTGPGPRRQVAGVRHHRLGCPGDQQVLLMGLPVTSLARTAADFLLAAERVPAVALTDAVLRQGVDRGEIAGAVGARRRARRARGRLALTDGRAESYLESAVRLLLHDAGLAPEVLQYPVWDGTRLVARLDLAYPSRRLAVEVDGRSVHGAPAALYADRIRQNALVQLGWTVLRFTWRDLVGAPAALASSVAQVVGLPSR